MQRYNTERMGLKVSWEKWEVRSNLHASDLNDHSFLNSNVNQTYVNMGTSKHLELVLGMALREYFNIEKCVHCIYLPGNTVFS